MPRSMMSLVSGFDGFRVSSFPFSFVTCIKENSSPVFAETSTAILMNSTLCVVTTIWLLILAEASTCSPRLGVRT